MSPGNWPTIAGRQHGNDLFVGFVNQLQDVDHLRTLDDGAERAGLQAFAAGDAGFVIDVLLAELIFGNGADRAGFLAGNRNADNRVVRTDLMAFAAVDAFVRVDMGAAVDKGNGFLGTVHLAGTREAAAAGVGNHVLRLDAGGTGNVDDAELRLFGMRALKGFFAVLRQAFELIGFFFRRKAEAGHAAVF